MSQTPRIKGHISTEYTVWCGLCDEFWQMSCTTQPAKEAKADGWRLTRADGWLCPKCGGGKSKRPKSDSISLTDLMREHGMDLPPSLKGGKP